MSPRKRARPSPAEAGSSTSLPTPSTPSAPSAPSQQPSASSQSGTTSGSPALPPPPPPIPQGAPVAAAKQVHKSRSWYGSWPRAPKSAASTQVARETILGGTSRPPMNSSAKLSRFDPKKASDSASMFGTSPPSTASLNANDTRAADVPKSDPAVNRTAGDSAADTGAKKDGSAKDVEMPDANADTKPPEAPEQPASLPQSPQQPSTVSSWLGWFGRVPDPEAAPPAAGGDPTQTTKAEDGPQEQRSEEEQNQKTSPETAPESAGESISAPPETPAKASGSWFGFLYGGTPQSGIAPAPSASQAPGLAIPSVREPEDVTMEDAPPADGKPGPKPPPPPSTPSAGSTWAFWSRDTGSKTRGKSSDSAEQGELAVIGDGSEARPQPASPIEMKQPPPKEPSARLDVGDGSPSKKRTVKKNKRLRPQSIDIDEPQPGRPATPKSDAPTKPTESSSKPGSVKEPPSTRPPPPSLLLPCFENTYHMKENPSIIKQIAQLLLRTQQPPANHVFLSKETPKIRKALAIGVHGLFPAAYLRPMIGQPTGTSLKFANHCADAIRRWADAHGCGDCDIEKVALEGEGKISDRVENLWKLLLNWIDHIRKADLIVVAGHSQGVPVSVMLVAKLIELGIITTGKIGICAMAGVSLGPFPDYKSGMGMLMGSAAELWEFANPESEVSKRYEASLKAILSYGVRITFVGSIDDQLVPLESSVYSIAHHPYIYRAVFIDGRVHAPDFIAHLVGFALKLRNLGISDHGLIRELSVPLAGSIYSGEGHSRLYDDEQVYDLAVSHTLETTSLSSSSSSSSSTSSGESFPCTVEKHEGLVNPNPYHLPWIMRGLLEEDFVKTELGAETAELLRQFDDWKPVTKALKDVKYRLEAVRSRL